MTGVEGRGPEDGPATRLEAEATLEGVAPGMAAERTDLAWSRSGVALLACGVVVLKGMPTVVGDPSRPAAGLLILALGAMTWGLGQWNARQRRTELGRPRPVARWRDMAPTALGTAGVGLAALFLAVFRPG
ncbi:MAG TPA: DUF202 domain-containing protein [Acidimicrobiales bacterium]